MAVPRAGLVASGILLATALALGLSIADDLGAPPPSVEEAAQAGVTGIPAAPLPDEALPSLPPIGTYAETLARPLFTSTRRPPEPEPEKVETAPPPPALDVVINGIIFSPDERLAILSPKRGGEAQRVPEGEKFQGWTLVEITPNAVTFREREREVKIDLTFDRPISRPGKTRRNSRPPRIRKAPAPVTRSEGEKPDPTPKTE